jgi:hypothetical protein
VRFGLTFILILFGGVSAAAQVGALQTDCGLGGTTGKGGYQFVATCAGRALSPDRHYSIVQRAYQDDQPPIELQNGRGRTVTKIRQLSDDMPFAIFWAPNSRWFLASHHVGSFMDRPEVYEVKNGRVIAHNEFRRVGLALAQRLFPCLPQARTDWANGAVQGWSKDSRRIAWVFITRTDMCSKDYGGRSVSYEKSWKPIWMISEIPSGRIIEGSVHIDRSETGLKLPADHRYDEFR